jgi:hypothetical protein
VACFCIEYITLFLGVSIFLRHVTILNILAHLGGLLLTILFYADVSLLVAIVFLKVGRIFDSNTMHATTVLLAIY